MNIAPIACNTKVAAEYLGISEFTLKQSRSTGMLCGLPTPPYRKAGTKVFYEISKLKEWLSNVPEYFNTAHEMLKKPL
ncbi:MAG: hypothetical protein LPK25_03210 [Cyclobacteriaceae bacterium]|nr:hypothetical protein [Cyclobacteriaceae bacterium]